MWDLQVTMVFNTKSRSNNLDYFGTTILGNIHFSQPAHERVFIQKAPELGLSNWRLSVGTMDIWRIIPAE